MIRLLRGEGWVELLFALIAISVFGVWGVTVHSSRLNGLTLWEAWQSDHQPAPTQRVAATVPTPTVTEPSGTLAGR